MYKLIVSNPRFALVWAVGLLVSVASFFSAGGGLDQIDKANADLAQKRAAAAAETAAIEIELDYSSDESGYGPDGEFYDADDPNRPVRAAGSTMMGSDEDAEEF